MKVFLSTAALTLITGTPASSAPTAHTIHRMREGPSESAAATHAGTHAGTQEAARPAEWVRDAALDARLRAALEPAGAPGALGAVLRFGEPMQVGAFGVRKLGEEVSMTPEDLVHIGSDTKAMTAVLIARLVEKGSLRWDATIEEVLSEIKDDIHPGYRQVTLAQLLQHTAGLGPDAVDWWAYPDDSIRDRRRKIARDGMQAEPLAAPGSKHAYSNLSVMIAGAMAEAACDSDWEALIRREVFEPLGMTSAGFGVPGTIGGLEQPWGHGEDEDGEFVPVQLDNNPALGPAGTVHLSLQDWGRFLSIFMGPQLDAGPTAHGGKEGPRDRFLSPGSMQRLLAPGTDGGSYGMGWILVEAGWAKGQALAHAGSNTTWFVNAWVAPEIDLAVFVAVNAYSEEIPTAADQFIGRSIMKLARDRSGQGR